jgi:hypothetical protein
VTSRLGKLFLARETLVRDIPAGKIIPGQGEFG